GHRYLVHSIRADDDLIVARFRREHTAIRAHAAIATAIVDDVVGLPASGKAEAQAVAAKGVGADAQLRAARGNIDLVEDVGGIALADRHSTARIVRARDDTALLLPELAAVLFDEVEVGRDLR